MRLFRITGTFLLLSISLFGRDVDTAKITIYYSATLNGNLDGCDCKGQPRAGLVKRAAYLRDIEDRSDKLILDAGDLLDVFPDELMAEEILTVYSELGYDAMALGDQEFSNGLEKLLGYRERFPLISHNISICQDETRCYIFTLSPLVLEKAALKIGIVSLIDPRVFSFYPEDLRSHLQMTPLEAAAETMAEGLRQIGVDITVLLFHGVYESAAELVRNVPGFDVAIVGHEQRLMPAITTGDTIVVSPGEEGNRLGILELVVSNGNITSYSNTFRLFEYEVDPDDDSVRERIDRYYETMRSRLTKAKSE